jgi:uncharacterized protein
MKKLGFGCMRLPLKDASDYGSIDMETMKRMVDVFLSKGFTYFDTAYIYHMGKSETAVYECLVKRHDREKYILATKLPVMFVKAVEDQERFFKEQLEKCGVKYFDYYLLHNLGLEHYKVAEEMNSFGFIRQKKAEGKIRSIGFSFHDQSALLDEILTVHPEVDFVQLQINYHDWDNEAIQSRKCYEIARKHRKPVIVMEPVKGGTLARISDNAEQILRQHHFDWSTPSWAIRFGASLEGVKMVLSGMSNLEQMLDNTSYMQDFEQLTSMEVDTINKVVDVMRDSNAIPCTACQYCTDVCPNIIAIPEYFALYNAEKLVPSNGFSIQKYYYANYTRTRGKASECIECDQCENNCPQHVPIIRHLKTVAETFEK